MFLSLNVSGCFPSAAFSIISLLSTFDSLTIHHEAFLSRVLYASCDLVPTTFYKFWEVSTIILLNNVSFPFNFTSTPLFLLLCH